MGGFVRFIGSGSRLAGKGGVGTSYSGGGFGGWVAENGSGSLVCGESSFFGFKCRCWRWDSSSGSPAWVWTWSGYGGGLLVVYGNSFAGSGKFESNGMGEEQYSTTAGYFGYLSCGSR